MKKNYTSRKIFFVSASFLIILLSACHKDKKPTPPVTATDATPIKLGLYEADTTVMLPTDTPTYREADVAITKIGTQTVDDALVFDTGSGGMVIDADGIVPASMITSTGFTIPKDSIVVNGVTITNQTSTIQYGDDASTTDTVYGNLAYADVTIGISSTGQLIVKRLPFFIYYKSTDSKGNKLNAHEFDVFGVAGEYDLTFSNGVYITSPFNYNDPGTGLSKGFKMAALGANNFTTEGFYVTDVITVGLTQSDLTSSGFTMNTISSRPGEGYVPEIPGTITYGGKTFNATVLFDTGTEPYNYIQTTTVPTGAAVEVPKGTAFKVATTSGFNYSFTVAKSDYLTYVENPNTSRTDVSVLSLEYFLNNECLFDFAGHQVGLKAN